MPPLVVVLVLAAATYRIARILPSDSITSGFRARLYDWAWDDANPVDVDGAWVASPRAPWRTRVWQLLSCQVCLGVWVAIAVYTAWAWSNSVDFDAVDAVITVAAIAGVQAVVALLTPE